MKFRFIPALISASMLIALPLSGKGCHMGPRPDNFSETEMAGLLEEEKPRLEAWFKENMPDAKILEYNGYSWDFDATNGIIGTAELDGQELKFLLNVDTGELYAEQEEACDKFQQAAIDIAVQEFPDGAAYEADSAVIYNLNPPMQLTRIRFATEKTDRTEEPVTAFPENMMPYGISDEEITAMARKALENPSQYNVWMTGSATPDTDMENLEISEEFFDHLPGLYYVDFVQDQANDSVLEYNAQNCSHLYRTNDAHGSYIMHIWENTHFIQITDWLKVRYADTKVRTFDRRLQRVVESVDKVYDPADAVCTLTEDGFILDLKTGAEIYVKGFDGNSVRDKKTGETWKLEDQGDGWFRLDTGKYHLYMHEQAYEFEVLK